MRATDATISVTRLNAHNAATLAHVTLPGVVLLPRFVGRTPWCVRAKEAATACPLSFSQLALSLPWAIEAIFLRPTTGLGQKLRAGSEGPNNIT